MKKHYALISLLLLVLIFAVSCRKDVKKDTGNIRLLSCSLDDQSETASVVIPCGFQRT